MYSLILMTAVAAGPDANAFGGRLFGGGCYGSCYGACYGSCYGSCYGYYSPSYGGCCGGYYGYSACYGCCGGFYRGGHHHRAYAYSSCCGYAPYSAGCCGGLYYSNYAYGCCGGVYGGCYGSYASYAGASCYGGCYGSCGGYGVVTGPVYVTSDYAAPGSTYTPYTPAPSVTTPIVPAPAAPATGETATGKPTSRLVPAVGTEPALPAPAQLTLELPADAKLFVDGQATKGTGAARPFHTPALPAGQSFFYEFRAEVEVNGKTEVETKRVVVRAGETLTESFPKLLAAVKAQGAAELAAK